MKLNKFKSPRGILKPIDASARTVADPGIWIRGQISEIQAKAADTL